ncbi:MAG: hypothetical protein IJ655_00265 [Lachnospiraceae bacterium]|nr:hypothetical protein [Lachnospiraceae bacterium]
MTIIEYLEKQEADLNNEKMQFQEDLELILSKIKENEKFYELLKSEESQKFNDFSPRDVNAKNAEKMKEIEETLIQLRNDRDILENKIDCIEENLSTIASLIEDNSRKAINSMENNNPKELSIDRIIHVLTNISSFAISDPSRTHLELEKLIKDLKNI